MHCAVPLMQGSASSQQSRLFLANSVGFGGGAAAAGAGSGSVALGCSARTVYAPVPGVDAAAEAASLLGAGCWGVSVLALVIDSSLSGDLARGATGGGVGFSRGEGDSLFGGVTGGVQVPRKADGCTGDGGSGLSATSAAASSAAKLSASECSCTTCLCVLSGQPCAAAPAAVAISQHSSHALMAQVDDPEFRLQIGHVLGGSLRTVDFIVHSSGAGAFFLVFTLSCQFRASQLSLRCVIGMCNRTSVQMR